jgi:hypothetical protein
MSDREIYLYAPKSFDMATWHTEILGRIVRTAVAGRFAQGGYWFGKYTLEWKPSGHRGQYARQQQTSRASRAAPIAPQAGHATASA